MWTLDIAPLHENLAPEAPRYGTRCQGISQFYLHTHAFIREQYMNHAFAFPADAGPHFIDPEGWKAEST